MNTLKLLMVRSPFPFVKLNALLLFLPLFLWSKNLSSQDLRMQSTVDPFVVIGFPGITQSQLKDFKSEYNKHPEIISAKFYYGNDNCMLIKVDRSKKRNLTYYDIVKCTNQIYPMEKCYLKPPNAFAEIEPNNLNAVVIIVK